MTSGQWFNSENDEEWECARPYPTEELAAQGWTDMLGEDFGHGDRYWVGHGVRAEVPIGVLVADDVIEAMGDALDETGAQPGDLLCQKDDVLALQGLLDQALHTWVEERGIYVNWWEIDQVNELRAPNADLAELASCACRSCVAHRDGLERNRARYQS